jgi:imidazolonepropionase-like amidohydrolase
MKPFSILTLFHAAAVAALIAAVSMNATAQTYAIRNARIVTVSGATIPSGNIIIQDGKISAVGPNIPIPKGATVVDGKGLTAYPGMIDPDTNIGLTEVGSVGATQDTAEMGDFNPHIKASAATNALSEHVDITRENGVTTVMTSPRGGLFAGQSAILNLDGWVTKDMLVKDSAAMVINFPREVRVPPNASEQQRKNADEQWKTRIELIRKTLRDAQGFAKLVDAKAATEPNLMLAALAPVVKGQTPVVFNVNSAGEIQAAIELAEEFKLKPILNGCTEAWKVADFLKQKNVPVLLAGTLDIPADGEPYDVNFSTPAILSKAGVKFALTSGGASSVRDLPWHAGTAAAYGLSKEEALKAVTIYPAQILNIADQVGTIQEGKVGNIMLVDGDPLELRTHVKHLFVNGKPVALTNKQTDLYEKFSKRPPQ